MDYTYVLRAFDVAPLRIVYSDEQCTMNGSSYTGNIPYMLIDVRLIAFAKFFGQTLMPVNTFLQVQTNLYTFLYKKFYK